MFSAFIDLYALVKSFRAIQTQQGDDDTHWLMFGVMRTLFRIVERTFECLTLGYLLTSGYWLAFELVFFWFITDESRAKVIFHGVSWLLSPIVDRITPENFGRMWQGLLASIDADGDGKVSPKELKAFLGARRLGAIVSHLDRDGDGKVSLEELKHFLKGSFFGCSRAQ